VRFLVWKLGEGAFFSGIFFIPGFVFVFTSLWVSRELVDGKGVFGNL
jgi:hypothetical protein